MNKIRTIYNTCCVTMNISLSSFCRADKYVVRRAVFFTLAREAYYYPRSLKKTQYSYQYIGGFCNRDHATVLHSLKVVEQWKENKDPLYKTFESLYNMCKEVLPDGVFREDSIINGFGNIEEYAKYLQGVNQRSQKDLFQKAREIKKLSVRLENIESDEFLNIFKPVPVEMIKGFKKNTVIPFLKVNGLYEPENI